MSGEFTDEQLSAFLDGELDNEQNSAIDAAAGDDPALRDRLEALALIDDRLRPAFGETLAQRVPERFESLLATPQGDARRTSWLAWFSPALATPIAAALVIGMLGGWLLTGQERAGFSAGETGALVARGDLAEALDSAASGETVQTGLGPMRVRLSFVSSDATACRQFHLGRQEALACLGDDGWTIDTLAPAPANVFADSYRMANGDVAAGVASAIERRGVATVLAGEEETDAIRSGWQTIAPQ